jgi:hypothetical protein
MRSGPETPYNENPRTPPYGVGGFVGQRPAMRRESMLSWCRLLVRIPTRGFLVQRRAQAANHILRNRIGAQQGVGHRATNRLLFNATGGALCDPRAVPSRLASPAPAGAGRNGGIILPVGASRAERDGPPLTTKWLALNGTPPAALGSRRRVVRLTSDREAPRSVPRGVLGIAFVAQPCSGACSTLPDSWRQNSAPRSSPLCHLSTSLCHNKARLISRSV